MAIGCGPKIAKFILIVFNIIFWLSGLILIIVGAVYLSNGTMKYVDDVIDASTNRHILIGFIVIGSIIFVIGFCGCCGAIKESRMCLAIYILLLLLIIVAEVAFGIYAIVKRPTVEASIRTQFDKVFQERYYNDTTIMKAVDELQIGFKCCGVNGSDNWKDSLWYKSKSKGDNNNTTANVQTVPKSCCSDPTKECWVAGNGDINKDGCAMKIERYIKAYFPVIIGVALGIAFFEIFVVICAFCLCRNTESQRQAV